VVHYFNRCRLASSERRCGDGDSSSDSPIACFGCSRHGLQVPRVKEVVSCGIHASRRFERPLERGGLERKFKSPPKIGVHIGALPEMIF
jgi:hypothetical protein